MHREVSAGGLVWNNRTGKFLLILDPKNKWALPKGHLEQGETADQAALREVSEETGLPQRSLRIVKKIGIIKYALKKRKGFKTVTFYLMETGVTAVKAQDEEINGVKWFERKDVLKKVGYANTKKLVARALSLFDAF